jgi:ABC-type nitrate/sulfonate/bicarbonate transport system permease component
VRQAERADRQAVGRDWTWLREGLQHVLVLRLLSLLSLIAVWLLLSFLLGPRVLPGPVATLEFLWQQLERGTLTFHIWMTMQRVLLAFALAMLLGVAAGVAMGASAVMDKLLEAWLVVGLAIPRIVLIVAAYLLIGLSESAAIIAVALTVAPLVVAQMREGTRAMDTRLIDMARAFKRPPPLVWRQVILPQLLPYIVGTGRAAMSLTWKMVVLAELLGRTSGVGYQISFYFQMFNMRGILAYALAMIIVLAIIDQGLMRAVERYAFRWRRPVKLTS